MGMAIVTVVGLILITVLAMAMVMALQWPCGWS
jgi:hypothetical protein